MRNHKWLAVLLLALACKGGEKSASRSGDVSKEPAANRVAGSAAGQTFAATEQEADKPAPPGAELADTKLTMKSEAKQDAEKDNDGKHRAKSPDPSTPANEAPTRAWFPETFLFEPLVVTNDRGEATVPVHVPDRLTTWRVLALAHSRTGAQAGATTSFLGTLSAYVDPVVPPFLIAGDEIRLPIQMVNTTQAAVTDKLALQIEGGELGGGGGTRTIPAQGSLVDHITLRAKRPGTIKLRVGLGATDAVAHTIDVVPAGKPVVVTRTGTLAAPRTVTIDGPTGSDPAADRVRLLVFPGALAILRSELAVSSARAGIAEDAYALLLAGRATDLLQSLGDKPDPEALRTLSIVTSQRAIRDGRTLDVTSATLLAEAAFTHLDKPVVARLGERAAAYLAQQQRPDGTFAGAPSGWTLQRVLVTTADATRAAGANLSTTTARQRAMAVQAKAAGAFARTADQITDGYTAAAILASGAVKGELADKLRARVLAAVTKADDGASYLRVDEGVVRADGTTPSRAEATALAVLALAGDPKAAPVLADLGTTLLGSYAPAYGWGDGVANLACMRAVLALFKDRLPGSVKITLQMDGQPVASGQFDAAQLKDVLVLDGPARGFAGKQAWSIAAEPAVPGLGYSLALQAWVPWEKQSTQQGLELALPAKVDASVGKATEIAITAIAPSGIPVHVQHALPAGVQVDRPSLEALVASGAVQRFEIADGKIDLHLAPLAPGQTFTAKVKVIATLAGTLHTGASMIEAGTTKFFVPPTTWTIR
ncbi:MAG TPA: alpha-2-macroglobulin family protein [Kofleriaceae bacterium]|nr:alpha-2-macroglobulin family protein [Kofleriaceae bacterium]